MNLALHETFISTMSKEDFGQIIGAGTFLKIAALFWNGKHEAVLMLTEVVPNCTNILKEPANTLPRSTIR